MKRFKKILLILLIVSSISLKAQKTVREFSFDRKVYDYIAQDSVKQIYNNQAKYFLNNPNRADLKTSISENYKFESLSFYSIPKFRLISDAAKKYNCNSNIENFIEFNEYIKYQDVVILNDKMESICIVDIPNFYYEQSRINNPDLTYSFDKKDYNEKVLEQFLSFPDGYVNKEIWRNITERKMNFFFTIYGIDSVLFEIDKGTSLLFANWMGTGSNRKRMVANDYIRKYR